MTAIRKLANAFYPDARPNPIVAGIGGYWAERFRERYSGLWVGGRVTLTDQGITFSPNKLNIRLHEKIADVNIAASNIESITYRFGWFTGIVEVVHSEGVFCFRCYGAKKLVKKHNEHVRIC